MTVSSSTLCLFLTTGHISHILTYMPRPTLGGVTFSALIFSCAPPHSRPRGFFSTLSLLHPAPLFGAWLFQHSLAPMPPTISAAWLFQLLSSPAPQPALTSVAFFAIFRFYVPSASRAVGYTVKLMFPYTKIRMIPITIRCAG